MLLFRADPYRAGMRVLGLKSHCADEERQRDRDPQEKESNPCLHENVLHSRASSGPTSYSRPKAIMKACASPRHAADNEPAGHRTRACDWPEAGCEGTY